MSTTDDMLAKYFAGDLGADEAAQLLALCRSDAAVRAELIAMTRTHRSMKWLHHDRDETRFESEVMMLIEPDSVESAAFVAGVIAKVQPVKFQRGPWPFSVNERL